MMRERAEQLRTQLADLRATIAPIEFELRQVESTIAFMTRIPAKGTEATRNAVAHQARQNNPEFQSFTMKQLVLKALEEQFVDGATSGQLLEFFARVWGRTDIMRSSFSPQLSRLKEEGSIVLEGRMWKLNDGLSTKTAYDL